MKKLTWLASYPKSGNTWVRAFLAAYHFQLPQRDVLGKVKFMTESESRLCEFAAAAGKPGGELSGREVNSLRADVQKRLTQSIQPYQLIKSHNARVRHDGHELICSSYTRGAVYVVRNPLDVVDSYADHANLSIDGAVDLMNDRTHSIGNPESALVTQYLNTWSAHVQSWTCHGEFPVHVVRYEDMQSAPTETFRGLIHFLLWELDEQRLRQAIANSSFEVLRQTEAAGGFDEQSQVAKSGRFFRHGRPNTWRTVMTPAQVQRIVDHHGEVMRQFGYSAESNTDFQGFRELRRSQAAHAVVDRLSALVDSGEMHTAMAMHQAGRIAEARDIYEQILKRDENHAGALHLLGVVCNQLGDLPRGIELISRAIALTPDVGVFYSNRAAAGLAGGDLPQAEADYQQALRVEPTLADAHNGLAIVCNRTHRPDEAIEHFRRAIELRPAFAEAHKNLGNALANAGRVDEGVKHLREAIKLRPSFAEAQRSLARWLPRADNGDPAGDQITSSSA